MSTQGLTVEDLPKGYDIIIILEGNEGSGIVVVKDRGNRLVTAGSTGDLTSDIAMAVTEANRDSKEIG